MPLVGLVFALRLAKPSSPWSRWFYAKRRPERSERARHRFAADRRAAVLGRRIQDLTAARRAAEDLGRARAALCERRLPAGTGALRRRDVLGRDRPAEQEALTERTAPFDQELELLGRLDPLGDRERWKARREIVESLTTGTGQGSLEELRG